ncbi:FAD-binding oxidoreductase [Haloarchaeobius sp. HME9146]|uniref:FAD-binding oxidoreductase n=1 Tax=Haloarchaeobius sp. HME9146 TaxID=2978732 RepID=UPI0021BF6FD3|nr:FAD-binding oxidoreductase [Haloarchaeobius sp. HME9146]MCT9097267.1 FAD-binding oxidoreductase [Haloarchaeobius sp. HME9146]
MTHDVAFLDDLSLAEDQVTTVEATRESHASDWGTPDGKEVTPDAVVYPESTADVSAILAAATDHDVPVTPYAAGTSLEGNAVPAFAGISMDLMRMDEVTDFRPDDFQVDVQPGVMGSTVDERAGEAGLFFPPLPSSGDISTIGGMLANAASGMQTVKYGEVADWVLEIEAVLADGSVISAGSRAVKTSSGYNLRDLLVGSEGTLAVITEATLRLAGRPEQIRGGRAVFETLDGAAAAVEDTIQSGVDVAKIELVDAESAMMANAYSGTDLPDSPLVFLEFHRNHGIEREVDFCRSIFEHHGATRFEVAAADEGMADLWQARKDMAYAMQTYDPDLTPLHPGDITVPISKYADVIRFAKDLADEHDVLVPCFGHAGDGNVHYSVLVDEDDPEQVEAGEAVYSRIVEFAIDCGGTCTGEHGIGLGKREYLEREHGAATVEAMRKVKRALDPTDTLNPGKMFPETVDGGRVRDRDGR